MKRWLGVALGCSGLAIALTCAGVLLAPADMAASSFRRAGPDLQHHL
ncbi:hypothetical protein AAIG88_13115, partial [Pseudomonas aeruginosa]